MCCAGSYEDWRPDASQFLASDKGAPLSGWPGEWWLDVRSSNVRRIMQQRIAMCKSKGFVAVDPDNVDGYTNPNGVGLTAADQLSYNTFLANEAHAQGMAIGLKNDLDQLTQLTPYFDFFVNEQCNQYSECGMYAPSKVAGKPVWNIEYTSTNFNKGCPQQATMGMRTILKLKPHVFAIHRVLN
ncbi:hypothetical protein MNEG_3671 [Monoraphidium neglectum]|uniref:Glycoside-hydrolase family GH114 TIM-barrel domain-containing protein n=1 Tax=Monoraphidium neglectum TaxID=145388 RepID=A0A0D2MNK3_9CHLO|nr:hypothetical protein MNEG_3671 [Monoraphidium neglectum]KIZ04285.1 hypothetical protein MNEG_3671 [Monoraphidium neglectum]|eukprot:XP_013903304.1 hypothetical protein MNEG_3671 [Monoraphidium neglectum]